MIVRIFRALKRYENRRRRRNKEYASQHPFYEMMMARWTRRVGLFTLALVFVSIVTAVIFCKQLSVMQGTLDEMQAEDRPWVSLSRADDKPGFRITRPLTFSPQNGAIINVFSNYRNTGKTPALRVRWHAKLIPMLSRGFNEMQDGLNKLCNPLLTLKSELLEKTIFPGDSSTEGQDVQLYPSDIAKGVAARQSGPFAHPGFMSAAFITCFDYQDASGKHYQTRYAFQLGVPSETPEKGFTGPFQGDFQPEGSRPDIRLIGPLYESADELPAK